MKLRYELILYCLLNIVFSYLKSLYFPSLNFDSNAELLYLLNYSYSSNALSDIFWLAPFILNFYLISKYMYTKLAAFNHRYRNRNKYLRSILSHALIRSSFYTVSGLFIPLVFMILRFNLNNQISYQSATLILVVKSILEISFVNLLIAIISLFISYYAYGFILVVAGLLIALSAFQKDFLPFVGLYISADINLYTILLIVILLLILFRSYKKMDLGEKK